MVQQCRSLRTPEAAPQKRNRRQMLQQPTAVQATEGNILVVDDDGEILSLVAKFLRANGFVVTTARNGAEMKAQMLASYQLDRRVAVVRLPTTSAGRRGRPGHRGIEPDRQRTATLERFVAGVPVPGLAGRGCGSAHGVQLPCWIHKMNPPWDLCNRAASGRSCAAMPDLATNGPCRRGKRLSRGIWWRMVRPKHQGWNCGRIIGGLGNVCSLRVSGQNGRGLAGRGRRRCG